MYATNNTVNIVQILVVIVLSAPIDYLMLKIDAGALWKRSYIHFVLLGPIPVLGNQVNDCSKFRAKK